MLRVPAASVRRRLTHARTTDWKSPPAIARNTKSQTLKQSTRLFLAETSAAPRHPAGFTARFDRQRTRSLSHARGRRGTDQPNQLGAAALRALGDFVLAADQQFNRVIAFRTFKFKQRHRVTLQEYRANRTFLAPALQATSPGDIFLPWSTPIF